MQLPLLLDQSLAQSLDFFLLCRDDAAIIIPVRPSASRFELKELGEARTASYGRDRNVGG